MAGIGIGNMGRGDMNAFLNRKDVQYVAVCDVREEATSRAIDMLERFGTERISISSQNSTALTASPITWKQVAQVERLHDHPCRYRA